jgi:hypothetical protein
MAWMRSETSGKFYLTTDYEVYQDVPQSTAEGISAVLGFKASPASSAAITAELTRVQAARAALVKDIADAVLAGVAAGVTVTADIDYPRITADTKTGLAPEFAALHENIDGQSYTVTPT